jgi:hypothetical protein
VAWWRGDRELLTALRFIVDAGDGAGADHLAEILVTSGAADGADSTLAKNAWRG